MNSFGLDLGMGACKLYGPMGSVEMPSQVSIWRDHARGLGRTPPCTGCHPGLASGRANPQP